MIDLTLPWCTYRSVHPSGLFYEGKAKTAKVISGEYKGSGIRFKLALSMPDYDAILWTTTILETFEDETAAYDAEALLVTIQSLAEPFRLNMMAGGRAGKYQTHSKLYKQIQAKKREETRQATSARSKMKTEQQKAKVKVLKQTIKTLKATK